MEHFYSRSDRTIPVRVGIFRRRLGGLNLCERILDSDCARVNKREGDALRLPDLLISLMAIPENNLRLCIRVIPSKAAIQKELGPACPELR